MGSDDAIGVDEEKKEDLGTLETEIGANDKIKVLTKEERLAMMQGEYDHVEVF